MSTFGIFSLAAMYSALYKYSLELFHVLYCYIVKFGNGMDLKKGYNIQ